MGVGGYPKTLICDLRNGVSDPQSLGDTLSPVGVALRVFPIREGVGRVGPRVDKVAPRDTHVS